MSLFPRPLVPFLSLALSFPAFAATWKGDTGKWDDAARWSPAPPAYTDTAFLENGAEVEFSAGEALVGRVDVAANRAGAGRLRVSGGTLLASEFLRAGEATGTEAGIVQTGGRIVSSGCYIGGANPGTGARPATTGGLELRGGQLIVRHIALGWAAGSTARLRIVGSKVSPPVVTDYLWVSQREKTLPPSDVEFRYAIDAHGVAPIFVLIGHSAIALGDRPDLGPVRLAVELTERPPTGPIVLMHLPKPCRGTFTDLPEGAKVNAAYEGKGYRWTLTYAAGETKSNIALIDPEQLGSDNEWRPYTGAPAARVFAIDRAAVLSAMRQLYTATERFEPAIDRSAALAFDGAEGYGAHTPGGHGGATLEVTSLADSGPGSLRAAIEAKGPRVVRFRTAGVIALEKPLVIREPYLTLSGEDAPGDGITIRPASQMHGDTVVLNRTHDIILRYLRIEHGKAATDANAEGGDCLGVYDSTNFIVDHCSLFWGSDETLSCTGAVDRYTVQWCLLAEPLNYHGHSMATLLGGGRCTWHHNLIAHSGSRNPNIVGQPRLEFRHNTIYDWGHTSGQGSFLALNYVANLLKPGPSTKGRKVFFAGEAFVLPGTLHLAGNVMTGAEEMTRDNWLGVAYPPESAHAEPFDHGPSAPEAADEAHRRVLESVGANLPKRHPHDARIIRDVQNGTGKIISSQMEVGGFSER